MLPIRSSFRTRPDNDSEISLHVVSYPGCSESWSDRLNNQHACRATQSPASAEAPTDAVTRQPASFLARGLKLETSLAIGYDRDSTASQQFLTGDQTKGMARCIPGMKPRTLESAWQRRLRGSRGAGADLVSSIKKECEHRESPCPLQPPGLFKPMKAGQNHRNPNEEHRRD